MYTVKNACGQIVETFSADSIVPGKVLYTISGLDVTVKSVENGWFKFEFCGVLYEREIKKAVNKFLFVNPFNPEYTYYDEDGFNRYGYDDEGFDRDGFNRFGYDRGGFNFDGYDREGFNRAGYGRNGLNREGYDKSGFDVDGINKDGMLWIDVAKSLPAGTEKFIYGHMCSNKGMKLSCCDCGLLFDFSFKELEQYEKRAYERPKRCGECRKKKKQAMDKDRYFGLYESMFRSNLMRPQTGREQEFWAHYNEVPEL